MNPWIGNGIFIAGLIMSILIRIPHDRISQKTKVIESRKTLREKLLLFAVFLGGAILPILSFVGVLSFADYILQPLAVLSGTIIIGVSLWLFYRSHADLGASWSPTLEIREDHRLITVGVYKMVRHPMYTSIFLLSIGQCLLLANWIAGPAMLIAFTAMYLLRLRAEEQMMLDKFGSDYEAYCKSTKRIIPGVL